MITRMDLRRFKCFEKINLQLRPLTLLSGFNASGKSTVLQALVLLHQTMREEEWSERLMLNGRTLRLGAVRDVLDQGSDGNGCSLALEDDDEGRIAWEFNGEAWDTSMQVLRVRKNGREGPKWSAGDAAPLYCLLPPSMSFSSPQGSALVSRLRGLTWLSAERIGPRDVHPLEDSESAFRVGRDGESAASVLYWKQDDSVYLPLLMSNTSPALLPQVEARMADLFLDFEMDLAPVPRANAVTMGFRASSKLDFHGPAHAGFGVLQALPIVVAILSAEPGDLFLIENPEAHLHPVSQSRMGAFLAEAANAGVQILVKSHSDHVLNGIRRTVREGVLKPSDVALYFFRPRHAAAMADLPQVENPTMDSSGNIDSWPEGFFDQFDRDLKALTDW